MSHSIFSLFRSKVLQKIKIWKSLCIFSPSTSRLKFYYITHLCEIELSGKFNFFQFFHCKTMYDFQKSQFHIKNVFFWGTRCWCSSKITRMVGGQICQFWLNWPPTILVIFELHQHIVSQKNTFLMWNWDFWKLYMVLQWKSWEKLNFLESSISHRCVM